MASASCASRPPFTAVAVITLALGIGAAAAILTLVQQVMLQPSQLWRIGDTAHCCYSDGYSQGGSNGPPKNDWSSSRGRRTSFFAPTPPPSSNWPRSIL
ncbi:MAG: hypothetical protein WCA38_02525 [Candidatus Acidiferrales bacterium]